MSDLRELYQEVVLDHGRHPRNLRAMEDASRQSVGYNPLCGDKLTLYLRLRDDRVEDVSFLGAGCAISMASASLLTETLRGRTVEEAKHLLQSFVTMLTEEAAPDPDEVGKLAVFTGVKDFPVRVKCATLAWRTLESALEGRPEPATTE
jgi:nitrogen fixation NifU-like protein